MNRLDYDLQEVIMKKTVSITKNKNDIWKNIEIELEENNMRKVKKNNKFGAIAVGLILVALIATAFTPPGRAAIGKIMDLFEPEKLVDTEVEGQIETTDQKIQVGTTVTPEPGETPRADLVTYVMYIDETRYSLESVDGVDRIIPLNYPNNYPEVYMEIKQVLDKPKEDVLNDIIPELENDFDTVFDPEQVTQPLEALKIIAHDGDPNGTKQTMPQWDSDIVMYYLVDNTEGGTFIIKMKFFIEAEEGHGSRFISMLDEFTIIPNTAIED